MKRIPLLVVVFLTTVIASASVLYIKRARDKGAGRKPSAKPAEPALAPSVIAKIPSISTPLMVPASEAEIPGNAEVLGVCVDESCRAYLLDAFHSTPFHHLVNDVVVDTPVSVSYCPITDCARVLTADSPGDAIELRVGGLGSDGMMLLYQNQWYVQNAANLPLRDLPFIRTTWSEWVEDHPHSDVYVGPDANLTFGTGRTPNAS